MPEHERAHAKDAGSVLVPQLHHAVVVGDVVNALELDLGASDDVSDLHVLGLNGLDHYNYPLLSSLGNIGRSSKHLGEENLSRPVTQRLPFCDRSDLSKIGVKNWK